MESMQDTRQSAFGFWLRTGRLPRMRGPNGVEIKFNPWHDRDNGRFTFAHTGQQWGGGGFSGGGGGTGGGAGASSSSDWPLKPRHVPPVKVPSTRRNASSKPADHRTLAVSQRARAPGRQYVTPEGYEYEVGDDGRLQILTAELEMGDTRNRSRKAQAQAGGADRRPTDDGGHYIAVRFNGPAEAFNHFAQDANFNRGRYRLMEDQWARAKTSGKSVWIKIVPVYPGKSQRPSDINVWFTIDGHTKSIKFPNERKDRIHGKR